jgi:glucokinase
MTILSVDIGGTKVAVALVTRQGDILAKQQQLTELSGPQAVVGQIVEMAASFSSHEPFDLCGVSVPAALGSIDTDRVIWAPNLPGWRDIPFREQLRDALKCPVALEFDGHASALGEWWRGAGQGAMDVASIIIGTGIGAGMVVDGHIWAGRNRLAGAVGWFPMMGPDGPDHWENIAAGPGITRRIVQLLEAGECSSLPADDLTAKDVFDAARSGDPLALRVIEETAEAIGHGVAMIISFANPEVVVLGGSVGQQGDLLLPIVREVAAKWAQPISAHQVTIVSSTLGEEASLLGAAYTALKRQSS